MLFMKALLKQAQKVHFQQRHSAQKFMLLAVSFLLMLCFSLSGFAQNSIRVKGRVTNQTGQPVSGASVTVRGSSGGTTTNDNGEYEITAPSNGTLVISSINFTTAEITINGR